MTDPYQGVPIPAPPQIVSSVAPPPQIMPMPAAPPMMPPPLATGPPPAMPPQCRVPGPPIMPPGLMQLPVAGAGIAPPAVQARLPPPVAPPVIPPPVLAPPTMAGRMPPPAVPPLITAPVGAAPLLPPVTATTAPPAAMQSFPTMTGRMPPPPQAWTQKPPPASTNGENKTQQPKPTNAPAENDEKQTAAEDTNGNADMEDDDKKKKATELVLPKALEDVLAFKDQRAAEFHINTDDFSSTDVEMPLSGSNRTMPGGVISNEYADGEDSDEEADVQANGTVSKPGKQSKAEKNKKKRLKKKLNRKIRQQQKNENQQQREEAQKEEAASDAATADAEEAKDDEDVAEETEQGKQEESKEAKSKEKHDNKDKDEKEKEKNKDKEKEKEKDKSKEKEKDKSKDKEKEKEKDKNKENEKDKDKDKEREKSKDRHRHRESSRREKSSKDKKDANKESKDVTTKDKSDTAEDKPEENLNVTIEYVPEKITIADLAPMYRQFYRVFEIFKLENKPKPVEKDKTAEGDNSSAQKKPAAKEADDDDDEMDEETKEDKEKLSKRKLKKLTRLSVAELKQLVNRPDVVEMHDVTARDPKLLVQLKAYRNTVQVPRHWCFKRKYLQGKRGIEKPPFDLPAFIKKTGIMEMRESIAEKDDAKSLKSKMRERVRPKMGKIDIDYQKLHDAFFKWQTKPRMTIHGDLYYEGKEFETRLKEKKPGDLSEELRIALGMPVGPSAHKIPPPWLIAQQRYGPPPSYPSLKIPGLNAPIPEGTSFGYHAGGWGKPPVDENGKPLYGDVFGITMIDSDHVIDEGDIERNQWGELESESEESSSEEEEDGEDMTNQPDETGLVTPAEGLVTPSGLTSVPAGMETPENIELRKRKIEQEMEDNETPVLYQVLPEKRSDRVGASMMGSTHVYDISTVNKQPTLRTTATTADREGTVELALDPSELDLDNDAMAQRYEQQMREQQNHLQKEDLSDLLAEHVARQKSKRKRQQTDTTKTTKKYKDFKF